MFAQTKVNSYNIRHEKDAMQEEREWKDTQKTFAQGHLDLSVSLSNSSETDGVANGG